jgi:TPR repeat protein
LSKSVRQVVNALSLGDHLSCEALGCGNLAYTLESGLGMAKDPARAGLMYQRACAANANQCVWLGIARHTGTGLPKDSLAASQEYDKTCSAAASRGSLET